MSINRLALAASLLIATHAGAAGPKLMKWPDLLNRPLPQATTRIQYGPDPLQIIDLFLPETPGPHPVIVMVHGGCWLTAVAKSTIMNYVADDLRHRGLAVWNIEYRGVDRPGGGYPGTFQDVAAAADALRAAAPRYNLRLDHIKALGHSAGGHLALWLAARPRLPANSPLHAPDPLPISEVVALGALPDLQQESTPPADAGCGADAVHELTGPPTAAHPNIYADTSPSTLLPLHVKQTLINGSADRIAPPAIAHDYVARAQQSGDTANAITIQNQGHVEEITPGTPAWGAAVAALK